MASEFFQLIAKATDLQEVHQLSPSQVSAMTFLGPQAASQALPIGNFF